MDSHRIPPRRPLLSQGDVLQDRFVIEGLLGSGGMASVYLARHKVLNDRVVAVKEMAVQIPDPVRLGKAVAQFESEARLLASLDHPGLVKVIDYFKANDAQYLVMEYVEGHCLDEVLPEKPHYLDIRTVLDWTDQLCDVLDYLHTRNPPVLFRDLKPSNVMLERGRKLRLIDFGIARTLQSDTRTATYIKGAGSIGYAPPEQFEDHTDIRSDIYALGATLYTLLTNDPPPASLLRAKGHDMLVPPRQLNAKVPSGVNQAVMHMLALDPGSRPQSIKEARQELHEDPVSVAPPPRWVFDDASPNVTMHRAAPSTPPPPRPITPPAPPPTPPPPPRAVSEVTREVAAPRPVTDRMVVEPQQPVVSAAPRAVALVVATGAILWGIWLWHQSSAPLPPRPQPVAVVVSSSPVPSGTPSPLAATPLPSGSPAFMGPVEMTGALQVVSHPPGGVVWVDSVRRGQAPIALKETAGSHQVLITLPGYAPMILQTTVTPAQTTPVSVTLQKIGAVMTSPSPSPPPVAVVTTPSPSPSPPSPAPSPGTAPAPQARGRLLVFMAVPASSLGDSTIGEMESRLKEKLAADGLGDVDCKAAVWPQVDGDALTDRMAGALRLSENDLPCLALTSRAAGPGRVLMRVNNVKDTTSSLMGLLIQARKQSTPGTMMAVVCGTGPATAALTRDLRARRAQSGLTDATLPIAVYDPLVPPQYAQMSRLGILTQDTPCLALTTVDPGQIGDMLTVVRNYQDPLAALATVEQAARTAQAASAPH